MNLEPLEKADHELIAAARDVLRRNHTPGRHTVGAAVRCASGRVYTGVNVDACGYGPCAETIAIGTAFSSGERKISSIVAVSKRGNDYVAIPPCGNCRQMLVDYSPQAMVILPHGEEIGKTDAMSLLPASYLSNSSVPPLEEIK